MPPERIWGRCLGALLTTYLMLVLLTVRDYGIGWDEFYQALYGDQILSWYLSLFRDRGVLTPPGNLQYYGGFFEVVAQLATRVSPLGRYETRHLVGALFALLAFIWVYRLATQLSGARAGFLAAIFLILTPRFYGHSLTNSKDIPFAVLYLVSVYYIIRLMPHLPHVPRGLAVKLGIAIGLTSAIRIGGAILFVLLFAALTLKLALSRLCKTPSARLSGFWGGVITFAKGVFVVGVVAYLAMFPWWPALQVSPIRHPVRTLLTLSRFPWPQNVFFEGQVLPATALPWYYIPKWILITVPEFFLVGLGLGGCLLAREVRHHRVRHAHHLARHGLLILAIVLPVAFVAVTKAVVYDAERHLLFTIPLLAVVSAIGVHGALDLSRRWIPAAVIVVAGLLALAAVDMVRLHPYQYIYFNRALAGGLNSAASKFDTDYWGLSYKEGATWIARNYVKSFPGRRVRVASCSHPLSTQYFLPDDRFEFIGSYDYRTRVTGHPDVFLATTRWECHKTFSGRVLHVVKRDNVPLLYVQEIEPGATAARPY
jgi:dolichyl-phosphate-mannose-protein mannosyltransferase